MEFKPVTINDKTLITKFTHASEFKNCDFAFSNMCSWRFLYQSEFAVADRMLFIRFDVINRTHAHKAYMFPVGQGDVAQAIRQIEDDAAALHESPLLLGITNESKQWLERVFPDEFSFFSDRNYFDYVYLRDDLLLLKGKKLQSKRNHINKFNKLYNYTYEPITKDVAPQCMALAQTWLQANVQESDREALTNECKSMSFALNHFEALDLLGGAIVIDGKIIAFSYGSKINGCTFGVHAEKADTNYEGAFSIVNQELVAHIPKEFIYINREEDLGIPGLRQAKLSYNPTILLEKYGAVKRR